MLQQEHPCKAISVGSCSFARLSAIQVGRDAVLRRSLTLYSSWTMRFCRSGMCYLSGALLGSRAQSDRLVVWKQIGKGNVDVAYHHLFSKTIAEQAEMPLVEV